MALTEGNKTTVPNNNKKDDTIVEATSSVLMSSAYFINEHCKDYSDDYMLCRRENSDPRVCEKEGRKVSRCVNSLLSLLDKNCPEEFDNHWKCLEMNNNYYWKCRSEEKQFNACVFKMLGMKKSIPDAPDYEIPVHMREKNEVWYK
jgi:NADH dehydrogenase (ubiquinone) 1 alpha subcomplex subunit 8